MVMIYGNANRMSLQRVTGLEHSCGNAEVKEELAYGFLPNRENTAGVAERRKKEES